MKGREVKGGNLALSADKPPLAVPVKVDRDKVTRAQAVTPLVEAGKTLLPERAGWLDDYLEDGARGIGAILAGIEALTPIAQSEFAQKFLGA